MKTNEIEEFILLCKKHGVIRGRCGDVELDFGRAFDLGPDAKKMEALAKALGADTLTDEQALFGSAPQVVTDEQMAAMLKKMMGQGA